MAIITGTDGNHKNSFGHSKAPLPFWQGRFMRLREPYSMASNFARKEIRRGVSISSN